MTIDFPDRVTLARTPTPLIRLDRTSDHLGIEVWVKRDDLTGVELSGNKVRKLEFLIADARAAGADTLITCGGEQSNHCRATAAAAAQLGLRSVVCLRTDDPDEPPPLAGNSLLCRLVGAEVVWISRADYQRRHQVMAEQAERVRAAGGTPYIIGEGGSNAVGAWGYINGARELAADLAALPPVSTTVVHACGSGGTTAGLVLGARMTELDAGLAAVNVCDDAAYFTAIIDRICDEFAERYGRISGASAADVDIIDGYVGAGYARSRPAELEALRDLARRDGILLDPVYTGKAFFGLVSELARDRSRFGDRVVFLHTGGLFGLFAHASALSRVL